MNIKYYDIIIINSSAGKDSLCAIYEICRMADRDGFDISKIHVSHQDLGVMEWPGTKELAERQAALFGLNFHVTNYRNKDGEELDLLDYVRKRGKWPSNKQRYCTSDFKRGPGARVVTKLTKGPGTYKVLYVFGFRSDESPARALKKPLTYNKRLCNSRRHVWEYLPIHEWSTDKVWETINTHELPYHYAYDLGMPRLSCCFCIFSPFDALVLAGKHNPEVLDRYVEVEEEIGHTFKNGFRIKEVKEAIEQGYEPGKIQNWRM